MSDTREVPLSEYPTMQFRRDSFYCLNGEWEFALDRSPEPPRIYPYRITVPFAVESKLSGIQESVHRGDYLHYRKVFALPEGFAGERVLLHFEAVDQIADVYLNGVHICHHEGGYLPFVVDMLELQEGENEILVRVQDDTESGIYPRGKQHIKPHGVWYTPTSGIWGSVWIEGVPSQVIQNITLDPFFDEKSLHVHVRFEGKIASSSLKAYYHNVLVGEATLDENGNAVISVAKNFHPWTPEEPNLYTLEIQVNDDHIHSYFAMRSFGKIDWHGFPVFALNGKPYFLKGVLDQGYWKDGGLTPRSDADLENDVVALKEMGFNMVRKHIKIEWMRWYYYCDVHGLIVIQDFVNGGDPYRARYIVLRPLITFNVDDELSMHKLGRGDPTSRQFFEETMAPTVERLYNCPCIAIWTLFNEGWGQFSSLRLTSKLRELDQTRLIDSTSGWFDSGAGDFASYHIYIKKLKIKNDKKRILALTECGGYAYRVPNHCSKKKGFAYRFFPSGEKMEEAYMHLYEDEIYQCMLNEGLSIIVITQLSDVELENNGFLTMDRYVTKVSKQGMKKLNSMLVFEPENDSGN